MAQFTHPQLDGAYARILGDVLEMRDPNDGQSSDPADKSRYQYAYFSGRLHSRRLPPAAVGDCYLGDVMPPAWEVIERLPEGPSIIAAWRDWCAAQLDWPDLAATALRVVGTMIGRQHEISRRGMAALLHRMAAEGLDLSNDCVYEGADTPEAWAARCRGICTVSVLADGATPHGMVRYDDPGSMHPMHHAAVLFAPSSLRRYDYDQIGQLRGKADRLLVVRDDPIAPPPGEEPERYECDNGHVWHATEEEDAAAGHRCPTCGDYWQ